MNMRGFWVEVWLLLPFLGSLKLNVNERQNTLGSNFRLWILQDTEFFVVEIVVLCRIYVLKRREDKNSTNMNMNMHVCGVS